MFSAAIYWQHCLQVAKEKANQRETPFPLLPSISHIVHLFACKWLRRKPTSVRPHVLNCHLLATLCIYLREGGWGKGQPAWDPISLTAIYWQHCAFICLQVAEEKANQRETHYKEQIKTLTAKLKQAEARSEFAEKSVQKLQKEVSLSVPSSGL